MIEIFLTGIFGGVIGGAAMHFAVTVATDHFGRAEPSTPYIDFLEPAEPDPLFPCNGERRKHAYGGQPQCIFCSHPNPRFKLQSVVPDAYVAAFTEGDTNHEDR